jgi:lipopolysaccharide exporter
MPGALTNSTLDGLKWSYASTVVVGVLQVFLTAVLARLLEPKSFGLIAMAGVVLRFGSYFAQMGMGSAIIQKDDLTVEDVRLSFTFSVGLSLLFFIVFSIGSPLAAWFFGAPELAFLLPAMAFSFVLTGVSTTAIALLRREFRFRLLGVAEILGYIIGYGVVGVSVALSGAGVWSLVCAALTQSGIVGVIAFGATRHEVKPLFSGRDGRKLMAFGGKVSIIEFLEFLSANLDTLVIGQTMGARSLGLYNRAYMLVNLPMYYLSTSLSRVLFPSFSRVQNEKERIDRFFRAGMLLMSALLFPLCFGIAGGARELVLTILGSQWNESIPILQVLALSTPFMLLIHIETLLLDAVGQLKIRVYIQLCNLLVLCTLFLILFPYGLVGLASAILFTSVILFVVYTAALSRLLCLSQHKSYRDLGPGVLSGCIILLVLLLSSEAMVNLGLNVAVALIAQLLLGGVIFYLLLVSPLQKSLRDELQHILSRLNIQIPALRLCQKLLWL